MLYSPSQRRGVVFLLAIISLFTLYQLYYNFQPSVIKPVIILNNPEESKNPNIDYYDNLSALNTNPNFWSKSDWKSLGFTKSQVKIILNFKEKIGGFKTKKQLFKCYAIDHNKKMMLDSLIKFPKIFRKPKNKMDLILILKSKSPNYNLINYFDTIYFKKNNLNFDYYLKNDSNNMKNYLTSDFHKNDEINYCQEFEGGLIKIFKKQRNDVFEYTMDINSVDSLQLLKISGIGQKTAKQILSYRNKLGGFHNVEQLKEVYLVSDSLFEKCKNIFCVETDLVKLNINTQNPNILVTHPYINWNLANAIVNYKFQHGNYSSIDKIKEIHLVNDEIYRKIAPYLKIM